jgi:hypothetical protein
VETGDRILILGASYGSLFASKLLLAGHSVHLVCPASVAGQITAEGFRVTFPVKGRQEPVEVDSRSLPGGLTASAPDRVDPAGFCLAVLAMQEPQFGAPEIRTLMAAIAGARLPCLSIMNMPPLPFLARIDGIDVAACRGCYADAAAWDPLDPALVTHCSADAQAARVAGSAQNAIQVHLPTNFRAARFPDAAHTARLRRIAADIDAARLEAPGGPLQLPVRLKLVDSLFVALSKWPMLVTGNYRCVTPGGLRSIREAVHADPAKSRDIYEWVLGLCRRLGAAEGDLVPFDAYAAAAMSLAMPSSAARALAGGATAIERVDRLVQQLAAQKGLRHAALDELVGRVDERLAANREASASRAH